ncbi:MAG: response regulator transcription factor [Proteobacteria bacterium]|nr:response regulator transcription factor [Pseudomonadota bacterium]
MNGTDSIVFIIDDDAQVRASLDNLCRSVNLPVETFDSTEEFLRRTDLGVPSCLVLDVRFPGSAPSGLEFQRKLLEQGAMLPIIFITGYGDVQMSVQAMKHGAVDFLSKPFREQELLDAIRAGIARDSQRRCEARARDQLRTLFESLTPREREIMRLVAQGLPNKQIAAALDLSEVTVKVHRSHVMLKMGAKSVADLVRMSDRLNDSIVSSIPTES